MVHVAVVQFAIPDARQQEEPRDGAVGKQFPTAATSAQPTGAHQHRFQS